MVSNCADRPLDRPLDRPGCDGLHYDTVAHRTGPRWSASGQPSSLAVLRPMPLSSSRPTSGQQGRSWPAVGGQEARPPLGRCTPKASSAAPLMSAGRTGCQALTPPPPHRGAKRRAGETPRSRRRCPHEQFPARKHARTRPPRTPGRTCTARPPRAPPSHTRRARRSRRQRSKARACVTCPRVMISPVAAPRLICRALQPQGAQRRGGAARPVPR